MGLKGQNSVESFAEDLDFAVRDLLRRVGPAYRPVWTDVDKGCGLVGLAATIQGHPLLRFFRLESTVEMSSRAIDEKNSQVSVRGASKPPEPSGQVILASPAREAAHGGPGLDAARSVLARVLPGWEVAWLRMGTLWPVAVVHRDEGADRAFGFVQVARYPSGPRVLVDAAATGTELAALAAPRIR